MGPALDEIVHFFDRWPGDYEVFVVDDGSEDATAELVRNHRTHPNPVQLIQHPANRGKGAAVRTGVMASRGHKVLFTDADLSTPLDQLDLLDAALTKGADIAIGSRAVRGARLTRRQPLYRVVMGKTFNKLVQLTATPGIVDTQCGFKLFRGDLARRLFTVSRIDGFGFDVEILFLARRTGHRIREIPVVWHNHPYSTVHPIRDSLLTLLDLIRVRINRYDL